MESTEVCWMPGTQSESGLSHCVPNDEFKNLFYPWRVHGPASAMQRDPGDLSTTQIRDSGLDAWHKVTRPSSWALILTLHSLGEFTQGLESSRSLSFSHQREILAAETLCGITHGKCLRLPSTMLHGRGSHHVRNSVTWLLTMKLNHVNVIKPYYQDKEFSNVIISQLGHFTVT